LIGPATRRATAMRRWCRALHVFLVLLLAFGAGTGGARAADTDPGTADFSVLQGRWVRPDGGYAITIRAVDANGKLDASYANPNALPFSRAEASSDGRSIALYFELRAGGYNGSTYRLVHEPAKDVLSGIYYQAVAQQQYRVYFVRAR
jgi:hypothetical protein